MKKILCLLMVSAMLIGSCNSSSTEEKREEKKDEKPVTSNDDLVKKLSAVADDTVKFRTTAIEAGVADESPRMKCLQAAQLAHIECLIKAKTDKEKSACNAALNDALAKCPPLK